MVMMKRTQLESMLDGFVKIYARQTAVVPSLTSDAVLPSDQPTICESAIAECEGGFRGAGMERPHEIGNVDRLLLQLLLWWLLLLLLLLLLLVVLLLLDIVRGSIDRLIDRSLSRFHTVSTMHALFPHASIVVDQFSNPSGTTGGGLSCWYRVLAGRGPCTAPPVWKDRRKRAGKRMESGYMVLRPSYANVESHKTHQARHDMT